MTDSKESIMSFFKINIIQPIDEIRKNIDELNEYRVIHQTDAHDYCDFCGSIIIHYDKYFNCIGCGHSN